MIHLPTNKIKKSKLHWSVFFKEPSLGFKTALRGALTISLTLAAAKYYGLKQAAWLLISLAVVIKPYIGGALMQARSRTLGTGAGIMAALLLLGFAERGHWIFFVSAVCVIVSLYLKPFSQGFFLGFWTFALVLIVAHVIPDGEHLAWVRAWTTGLGVAIGVASSYFIWPESAFKTVPDKKEACFKSLSEYFGAQLKLLDGQKDTGEGGRLRMKTVEAIEDFKAAITESQLEAAANFHNYYEYQREFSGAGKIYNLLVFLDGVVRSTDTCSIPEEYLHDIAASGQKVELYLGGGGQPRKGDVDALRAKNCEILNNIRLIDRNIWKSSENRKDTILNVAAILWHFRAILEECRLMSN